jgi:CheY-like chemotaxis protein
MLTSAMQQSEAPEATIPYPAVGVHAGLAADGPAAQATAEVILLVEDEPVLRELQREILELSGYEVLVAGDGVEGLRVAQSHPRPIGLLVTDLVMPEMNGQELARQLVGHLPELKVLFVSGHADHPALTGGPAGTGAAFLRKPFTLDDLTATVGDLLSR